MILQIGNGAVAFSEIDRLVDATAGQSNMLCVELGARDDPGLAERRQPHGLRAVELRVLESRQANELRNQGRRKRAPSCNVLRRT